MAVCNFPALAYDLPGDFRSCYSYSCPYHFHTEFVQCALCVAIFEDDPEASAGPKCCTEAAD